LKSPSLLKQHFESFHSDTKKLPCPHCKMSFKQTSSLKEHIEKVHDFDKEFQCGECQVIFLVKDHLKNHLRSKHVKTEGSQADESLGPAETEFEQAGSDEDLGQAEPEESMPFDEMQVKILELLGEDTKEGVLQEGEQMDEENRDNLLPDEEQLDAKAKKRLQQEEGLREKEMHVGALADEAFQEGGLSKHGKPRKVKSDPSKRYPCQACGKSFQSTYHLKRHVDTVHSKVKRFFCPQCDAGFYFQGRHEKHLLKCLNISMAQP